LADTSAPSVKNRFSRKAVTRATTLTRLIASMRPRNSLVSVIGRLTTSTTPTAGGSGACWAGAAHGTANVAPNARKAAIVLDTRPVPYLNMHMPENDLTATKLADNY